MTTPGVWTTRRDAQVGAGWANRPRYALADFATLLWRERVLIGAVFAVLFILGMAAAFSMKTKYPAYASVLVRLGQEYVYEPRAGDAARGAVPDSDQLIQSETEILGSVQVKQRVINRLGLTRIYPELGKKYAKADPAERRLIMGEALKALESSLAIETAPDTPIIRVGFEHPDPRTAALVLNTVLEEYLIYRRDILGDSASPVLEQQRQAFESRLAAADAAYEDFLNYNRIGDFASEKASLSQLQAQVQQQKLQVDAQLQDRVGRLSALNRQFAQVSPEVRIYRDVNPAGADKLVDLKVQREDLLSRYRPDSQPVRELDAQIAHMEQAINAGRTTGDSAKRYGVNPVYQTLQTDKIQLTAEVAALREQQTALAGQLDQLLQRRLRLAQLEPRFQELSLDRDVLQANVRDFTVKEEESRAAQQIAAQTNDNVRIVARAIPPTRGKSLKKPVAVLALLFAGFTALCAGLVRMYLRPGLPTPRTAARTLQLPVLASARLKGA
ncbi:GumC family protein [Phenylobacterium sp.]|uniref:GumC family protein n=1 Tax=Phenylobacterium sp. TaxID=1871053 RepID=UPI0035B0479A